MTLSLLDLFDKGKHQLELQSNIRVAETDILNLDGKANGELSSERDPCEEEDREQALLATIETEQFNEIKTKLTAKALMNLEENPLLSAIRVTEKLHDRASKSEYDKEDFINLANSVEEFTLRFLDPMKYHKDLREEFSTNPQTECILETAIKLEQKKFFDHPIIIDLMLQRWYREFRGCKRGWWLFLNFWCIFDIMLFPLMFSLAYTLDLQDLKKTYSTAYFIFVRDALSYLVLLGLHFAICLEPSCLSFSRLEWTVLIFLLGRLMVEGRQIVDKARSERQRAKDTLKKNIGVSSAKEDKTVLATKTLKGYLRDRWNIFDLIILFTFFCGIVPLRIFSWAACKTITSNRILVTAEYLYGFNTMLLTFRVIGYILETVKGVGTIQIALFQIIRDVIVVVVHFMAITLAFSSTITKIFVAESSMVKGNITGKEP